MNWVWIRQDVFYAVHKRQLAEHGGLGGVRDHALLESAMIRPQNLALYESTADLADLASAYATGIVKNHPFVDGNKRVAHVVYQLFLELNGYTSGWAETEKYQRMLQLSASKMTEQKFAELLRPSLKPKQ
ncbi:MAG: type II toxin-antitoxin system death-on-curing family toxin [Myxococcales bacterium]|nr:MAG: type II toxin-antitoxin system death-on-curing family toxin [Myxococcales bacterium]